VKARKSKPIQISPQALTWPDVGALIEVFSVMGRFRGKELKEPIGQYIVNAACENPKGGHWYCVTHQQHFDGQFSKDVHISRGAHQLVWCCNQHGLEIDPKWATEVPK
jgi:hypothetical protein